MHAEDCADFFCDTDFIGYGQATGIDGETGWAFDGGVFDDCYADEGELCGYHHLGDRSVDEGDSCL